jgi:hypothetical protein
MHDRIERLRTEIARVLTMAEVADEKAAAELHALARDMEHAVSEIERWWVAPRRRAALE